MKLKHITKRAVSNQVPSHINNGFFSNLDLIIYLGCETGKADNNLCTQSVLDSQNGNTGANVAIGFQKEIQSPYCNTWLKRFFDHYSDGFLINECVEYASTGVGTSGNG